MSGNKKLAETMAAAARSLSAMKAPNRAVTPRVDRQPALPIAEPTNEQRADGSFDLLDVVDKLPGGTSVSIGKAYRRRPMIDTLAEQGVFTAAEHKALKHYRHHADIADRSPTRDSLNMQRTGGSGTGPTVEMLNAVRVRGDCERAAGSLADILRAVVVDDMSLSQWAMRRGGSVETHRVRKGKSETTVEPKSGAVKIARLEIKAAAQRVQAELDA